MDWNNIVELLSQPERQDVVFKGRLPDSRNLLQDLADLANRQGGQAILGVDDNNRHLVGSPFGKDTATKLISQQIIPDLQVLIDEVEKNNHLILVFSVSEGMNKPYLVVKPDDIVSQETTGDNIIKLSFAAVDKNKTLPSSIRAYIPTDGSRKRQHLAMEYVEKHLAITNRQYRKLFSVSHKTAHLELVDLVQQEKIESVGAGRSTFYKLLGVDIANIPSADQLNEESLVETPISSEKLVIENPDYTIVQELLEPKINAQPNPSAIIINPDVKIILRNDKYPLYPEFANDFSYIGELLPEQESYNTDLLWSDVLPELDEIHVTDAADILSAIEAQPIPTPTISELEVLEPLGVDDQIISLEEIIPLEGITTLEISAQAPKQPLDLPNSPTTRNRIATTSTRTAKTPRKDISMVKGEQAEQLTIPGFMSREYW